MEYIKNLVYDETRHNCTPNLYILKNLVSLEKYLKYFSNKSHAREGKIFYFDSLILKYCTILCLCTPLPAYPARVSLDKFNARGLTPSYSNKFTDIITCVTTLFSNISAGAKNIGVHP